MSVSPRETEKGIGELVEERKEKYRKARESE